MNIETKIFFPNIWTPSNGLSEMITTYCAVIILALFIGSLITQLIRASRWKKRLKLGISILTEASSNDLVRQRREIDEKMGAINILGDLWHEFDETLVECPSGERVYNTLDADHFFNTSTLGTGVTESRFIAAVPGMLTAIGIFGTFLGLMLGLHSLDMTNANTMQDSIGMLIEGAAVAFTTSVWGIAFSLAFNIAEKIIEGRLINRIRTFQLKTDRLFARNLAERSLLNIQEKTSEAEKLLRVLGEQIGDKVQEGISSAIEPQLKKLAQTMEDLANRQASGAEEALRQLVEEFTGKMGEAGAAQSKAMEEAAQSLTQAMEELDATIGRFLNKVEDQIKVLTNANEEGYKKLESFATQSSEFVTKSETTIEKYQEATAVFEQTVEGLRCALRDLTDIHEQFEVTVIEFANSQTKASDAMSNSSNSIIGAMDSFKDAGNGMFDATEALKKATSTISEAIRETTDALSQLPEQNKKLIEESFATIKAQFEDYSDKITNQFEEFAEAIRGSTDLRVSEWTQNTQLFCNQMRGAVEALSHTIDEVERKITSMNES